MIIGALANGCSTEMEPHLPVLLPFLCQQVASSEVPEVRSISCWVLGRYAEWSLATLLSVCDTVESEDGDDVLYNPRPYDPSSNCYDLMLSVLLPGIVDKQTKVQSAALSALNAVISGVKGVSENEMCALLTVDRLALIFEQVASASHLTMTPSYGVRNCLILCDLIAAVCEAAGELAATPALVPMYLPFVMHQYLNVFTDDTSVYLFPVMEAITAVLAVVGMQVHVYAVPLLKRSIQIAGSALQAEQEERQERPESNWGSFHLDFVVCAFDVIGALSECLVPAADMAAASIVPTNFSSLLTEVGVNVVLGQMVVAALSIQTEADLLQSAFALCGELFRTAMIALLPASSGGNPVNVVELILGKIVHILSIPDTPLAVASNALWAAGEALMRLRHVSGGILDAFLSAVLPILLRRMVEHVRPVVDYGIDRFGPLATSLTTPPDMDPEADMEIFLESLGAHQNLFLQNAAVTLGRIAVQNMPMFLYYLEQPSESTVNFLQSWYAALSLVSTDMKERNHAFMGLLSVLQAKPDLLQLVSSVGTAGGASRQCLSDSATLLLFGTALAWRQTADLDGEGTDVYLALRGAMLALQAQLNQCRENGLVIDKRLVGVFALFRYLSESFNI